APVRGGVCVMSRLETYRKVVCPICGSSVARRARQQRFCSARCKERQRGRTRVRKSFLTQGTPKKTPQYQRTARAKIEVEGAYLRPREGDRHRVFRWARMDTSHQQRRRNNNDRRLERTAMARAKYRVCAQIFQCHDCKTMLAMRPTAFFGSGW